MNSELGNGTSTQASLLNPFSAGTKHSPFGSQNHASQPEHAPTLQNQLGCGGSTNNKAGDDKSDAEAFLDAYERRANVLLVRYYASHTKQKQVITAKMFREGAGEILKIYKDTARVVPVEIPFAQLVLEGGLSGKERTSGNVFNVGETDSGGHINGGASITYDDGFKAYYHLIAKKFLDEKTASQLLEKGSFTNGKGTDGGVYASNTMYESLLKSEIGNMYVADSGFSIKGSVGKSGKNSAEDVHVIGQLLVKSGLLSAKDVDDVGKVTAAIGRFQKESMLPDEESDWHARRVAAIKGKGKSELPDGSPELSGAARQSLKDISTQKSWFKDSTIHPGGKTLGALYFRGQMGGQLTHQGQKAGCDTSPGGQDGAPVTPGVAQESGTGSASEGHGTLTVKDKSLNVRATPSIEGKKLGSLPPGSTVESLGRQGGWYQFRFQGHMAFVSALAQYVHFEPSRLDGGIGQVGSELAGMKQGVAWGLGGAIGGGLGKASGGGISDAVEDVVDALCRVFDWLSEAASPGHGLGEPRGSDTGGQRSSGTPKAPLRAPPPDALIIQQGELTTTGEGSDAQTRYIHWPNTDASGVTLGKGYDIGSRSQESVIADLTAAGMSKAQAVKIAAGAGLKGPGARDFVAAHKSDIGEIPKEIQYNLLAMQLEKYTELAHRRATDTTPDSGNLNAAAREKKDHKPAGTFVMSEQEWRSLHPAMVEFLTDLIYQGGYYGYDRVARINAALKAHDGDVLAQFQAVRKLFEDSGEQDSYMDLYAAGNKEKKGGPNDSETFYGQKVDLNGEFRRNEIRRAYLDHVITALSAGKPVVVTSGAQPQDASKPGQKSEPTQQLPGSGQQQDKPASLPDAAAKPHAALGTATTLTNLNVRAEPAMTGRVLETLPAGSSLQIVSDTHSGWLQTQHRGAAAFVSSAPRHVHIHAAGAHDAAARGGAAQGGMSLQHLRSAVGHFADDTNDAAENLLDRAADQAKQTKQGQQAEKSPQGSASAPESAPDQADDVTLSFGTNANDEAVSAYSRTVLKSILRSATITSATITSTARTAADQARVMYNNLESHGVTSQHKLYGASGDKVIDMYEQEKKLKKTAAEIKAAMEALIMEIGPSNVSHHCVDLATLNVVDISPGSIPAARKQPFITAVNAESRVSKFLQPPADPAYHLEIPQ